MWGGSTFYAISEALPVLKAFYDFNGNPNYDPYAAVIQSIGYSGTMGVGVGNNYEYTKPESNAPAFSEFLAVLNQLFSTQRIRI